MTLPLNTLIFPYYQLRRRLPAVVVVRGRPAISAAKKRLRELLAMPHENAQGNHTLNVFVHVPVCLCTRRKIAAIWAEEEEEEEKTLNFSRCLLSSSLSFLFLWSFGWLRELFFSMRNYTTTSFGCILSFPLFFLLLLFLNLFIVVLSCARQLIKCHCQISCQRKEKNINVLCSSFFFLFFLLMFKPCHCHAHAHMITLSMQKTVCRICTD